MASLLEYSFNSEGHLFANNMILEYGVTSRSAIKPKKITLRIRYIYKNKKSNVWLIEVKVSGNWSF